MTTSKPKSTSQGPLTMWHCMDVPRALKLLSLRPPIHWSRAPRWAMLPPCAIYNSVMRGIERMLYSRQVAKTEIHPSPVFILGHWRSGTTLLHNLLSLDDQFTYPTLYQAAFPHHFLLTERVVSWLTAPLLPKSRPMDNMEAGWGMPQEDEIGLSALCMISPYVMVAFPEKSSYIDYYELKDVSPEVRDEWKRVFLDFLRRITYRKPKRIVLKSPSHTWRIPLMLELFPQAKFIYIQRHPYDVLRSTMHLRATLFEANTLGWLDPDSWEEDILFDYRWAVDCYERDKHLIPQGNLHELRFEDLEADPLAEMERAYSVLSLGDFNRVRPVLMPEVERLKGYQKNTFRKMPQETKRRVYDRLRSVFDQYGYDPEDAIPTMKQPFAASA